MEETILHQLLDRANTLFRQLGVGLIHEEQLAAALDCTPAAFREQFGSKAELLLSVTQRNLQRQRQEHAQLFANLATPAECLVALLRHSLHELRTSPHHDYHIMRDRYPGSWNLIQDHLHTYSRPQLTRLLADGIQQGQFRATLNPSFIAHIVLAQFSLVFNEQLFPPDQISQADTYRNIFAPYVRGLCTTDGLRLVASHFERL
ncbi:TetR/AcrR family transcriptional regulator [Hymenobacter rubripertinctus]|uniref:TetR/AcrR family transcriptional regulator n=1 Tax=Hymenobacter rubripertinctus TaxID=2029981 RepID=A0A418R6R0_9BACT|nr:TetR/AcrR family transcriptional regulator [Hymenobacter rubripertinctus]RIY12984.1 TetR/AcrR family transcriptional regulator [Hymenobacter rubripertinctus]